MGTGPTPFFAVSRLLRAEQGDSREKVFPPVVKDYPLANGCYEKRNRANHSVGWHLGSISKASMAGVGNPVGALLSNVVAIAA
jgi:hypothetical protein